MNKGIEVFPRLRSDGSVSLIVSCSMKDMDPGLADIMSKFIEQSQQKNCSTAFSIETVQELCCERHELPQEHRQEKEIKFELDKVPFVYKRIKDNIILTVIEKKEDGNNSDSN